MAAEEHPPGDEDAAPVTVEVEPRVTTIPRPPATRALRGWWVLAAGAVIALVVAIDHLRWATVVLGGALGVAAVARLVLPQERAGGLVVRGRFFDVVVLVVLAAAVLVSGFTLDLRPR